MASATRFRRAWAAVIACSALLLVAGCAAAPANDGASAEVPVSAVPTPKYQAYPMPDLGPSPPPVPVTDDETEQRRLQQQDEAWKVVQDRYPEAVRPDVTFEGYLTEEDHVDVLSACYEAAGLTIDYGTNSSGEVAGVGTSPDTEAEAVAVYACSAAHPSKPWPHPSPEQVDYIYDFLVLFLAPCYEANGFPNPPPPSREEFSANWPKPGWYPSTGNMPLEPADDKALNEACPPTP